jgi:hypothetical protein
LTQLAITVQASLIYVNRRLASAGNARLFRGQVIPSGEMMQALEFPRLSARFIRK